MTHTRPVLLTIGGLLASAAIALAQPAGLTGVVVDARTERPLAGVLVAVDGQPIFVETDAGGGFTLAIPPGNYSLVFSSIGYAILRQAIEVPAAGRQEVTVRLSEGAGAFAEHVTVAGTTHAERDAAPGGAALYGRELQTLRGAMLDDPLRALQALPSASATDDFYSEFAVRGSSFRHLGLSVDGIPTRYLMHAVHGVTDGGSIAMINAETLGAVSLLPGSYPQRNGRRLGAQVDLTTRDGNRERFGARLGLSGTSATALAEGPIARGRGAWLVSARRSYLDLLVDRIDPDGSFAFGFSDVQGKLVYDLSPAHQVQFLAVGGRSRFDEEPQGLGLNDEAVATGRTWLAGLTWRYAPSAGFVVSQRVYSTGLSFHNVNAQGSTLESAGFSDLGWRADAAVTAGPRLMLEFGGDVQRLTGRHATGRALNDEPQLHLLRSYDRQSRAYSGYVQAPVSAGTRVTITPGVRVDVWQLTDARTASPWLNAEWRIARGTQLRAGSGVYRQYADFDQVESARGGERSLLPEAATHVDVGVRQSLPLDATLQLTWFVRNERDVLWARGAEPRRQDDHNIVLGRGDAPWANALAGRARGVELVLRRDVASGLSGWLGYAYNRHHYTDTATGEGFWADVDQRHALSLYGSYRLSHRSTLGAKFRYGSNYPMVGYIGEQPMESPGPPLFGGGQPLFYGLTTARNTLRLPAYARLDIRADRNFTVGGKRVTVFAEVANALNRRNVRNVPYGVDRRGFVMGPTDSLLPILPSGGLVIEF